MPESDGIRNGVPLDEHGYDNQPEIFDLTPQGFNQRMRDAISSSGSKKGGDAAGDKNSFTSAEGNNMMSTGGFTIKAKLMASLSLLTLIILILGVISFTSIVEIYVAANHGLLCAVAGA